MCPKIGWFPKNLPYNKVNSQNIETVKFMWLLYEYVCVYDRAFYNFKKIQCVVATGYVLISPNFVFYFIFYTDCKHLASLDGPLEVAQRATCGPNRTGGDSQNGCRLLLRSICLVSE